MVLSQGFFMGYGKCWEGATVPIVVQLSLFFPVAQMSMVFPRFPKSMVFPVCPMAGFTCSSYS